MSRTVVMIIRIVVWIVVGYLFGLFPTGILVSKSKGIDITQQGSGNTGATNTLRVMGKKAGVIVLAGDLLKALIPCMAARLIYDSFGLAYEPDMARAYVAIVGLGVVLGHNFPFYRKFKGGKGISSTTGVSLALDWRITAIGFVLFVTIVAVSRYVSVASMCGVLTLAIMLIFFSVTGSYGMCPEGNIILHCVGVILVILAAWAHRTNWKRLRNGTENRFSLKKTA